MITSLIKFSMAIIFYGLVGNEYVIDGSYELVMK